MKKSLFVTSLLLMASTSVLADSFNGPTLKLGLGFADLSSNVYYYGNGSIEEDQFSRHAVLGTVALGYSKSLPNKFNIATHLFYNVGSKNSGFYSEEKTFYEQSRITNIWGLSLDPGYYWSEKTLGYLKLGVAKASSHGATVGFTYSDYQYGPTQGFLYGLGLQHLLTKHFFIGIEGYHIDFATKTSGYANTVSSNKPSVTYNAFNVGYKY